MADCKSITSKLRHQKSSHILVYNLDCYFQPYHLYIFCLELQQLCRLKKPIIITTCSQFPKKSKNLMRFGYISQALFKIGLVHFWLPFCCSRVCVTFLVLLASQSAAVLWLQLVHIARSTSTGYGSTSQQAELLVKLTPPLPLVQTVSLLGMQYFFQAISTGQVGRVRQRAH